MYTTKPLSLFKSHPEAATEPPPEGPNSGYLVVKSASDEEDDETSCWGGSTRRVLDLPFPQNRVLRVEHGEDFEVVMFVPIPGQPLASNRYYVVVATGKHKGLLAACSREDMTTCCFCRCRPYVEPRPFDPADVYQQIEVVQLDLRRGWFTARAVATDGSPPFLYSLKNWDVCESKNISLSEAPGLDAELRSHQLAGASPGTTTTAVGKWYCPFFLIRERGLPPREQMSRSAVYEVLLEQRWEPVRGDAVRHVHDDDSKVAGKKVLIGGNVEAKPGISRPGDVYMWFTAATGARVGVCTTVWERMLWEQTRGGWVDEEDDAGNIVAGGSVLVERFVVKRMDASVVVAFDFVHHNTMVKADNV